MAKKIIKGKKTASAKHHQHNNNDKTTIEIMITKIRTIKRTSTKITTTNAKDNKKSQIKTPKMNSKMAKAERKTDKGKYLIEADDTVGGGRRLK